MIKIDIVKGEEGFTVQARGHSNYNKHGEDIVCAGISALTMTLINSLESAGGWYETGDAYIDVTEASEEDWQALRVIEDGYALLENYYPDDIMLHIEDHRSEY